MSFSKYKRLCLVLFLPLLFVGFIFTKIVFPYDKYFNIACEKSLSSSDICRDIGKTNGSFYEATMKQSPAGWASIHTAFGEQESAPLHPFVYVSSRNLFEAEILAATPFSGDTRHDANFYKNLVGMKAIVKLGTRGSEENPTVSMVEDKVMLYCNDLHFSDTAGVYKHSHCFGPNWGASIHFRVFGESQDMLEKLHASIIEEIQEKKFDYRLYQIVMYPLFLYAFFVLSLLVFLSVKAIRFVKNG